MKVILYIRKGSKSGRCTMHTQLEDETSYDTLKVINLAVEIRRKLDDIIASCEADGLVAFGKKERPTVMKTEGGAK